MGFFVLLFWTLAVALVIFTLGRLTIHIFAVIYSWRSKVRCQETIERTAAECAQMFAKDLGWTPPDPEVPEADREPDKAKAMFQTVIERYLLNLVASDKP